MVSPLFRDAKSYLRASIVPVLAWEGAAQVTILIYEGEVKKGAQQERETVRENPPFSAALPDSTAVSHTACARLPLPARSAEKGSD